MVMKPLVDLVKNRIIRVANQLDSGINSATDLLFETEMVLDLLSELSTHICVTETIQLARRAHDILSRVIFF